MLRCNPEIGVGGQAVQDKGGDGSGAAGSAGGADGCALNRVVIDVEADEVVRRWGTVSDGAVVLARIGRDGQF